MLSTAYADDHLQTDTAVVFMFCTQRVGRHPNMTGDSELETQWCNVCFVSCTLKGEKISSGGQLGPRDKG